MFDQAVHGFTILCISTMLRAVRDDFNSASPTSSAKMNPSIRAPRSGSGIMPKLSPVVHRATAPNDWELSHCMNKPPAVGANNRKRTASARSSSPPVAHWAGQRPQKIYRTARRTNLVPIVNNDESPTLDSVSDVSGNEIGVGFARRLSGNSPQQVKLKGDTLSSAVLSESEESGATEVKSKDKSRKSDEIDEKAGQNVQKISPLGLPSRKNKLVSGEDIGDGVRRQGRTGRGFTSTRSLVPTAVEKLGNVGTAKQLRSARLGFDKNERSTFCIKFSSYPSMSSFYLALLHVRLETHIFKKYFCAARQAVLQPENSLIVRLIHAKRIQQSMQQQIFLVLYFKVPQIIF